MSLHDDVWKLVWRLEVSESVRCFTWQLVHGKLATKGYCGRWTDGDLSCHHCRSCEETILHVLHDCSLARQVWIPIVPDSIKSNFFGLNTLDWVRFNLLVGLKFNDTDWRNLWAFVCHHL